jgi:phospholipid-binding lipoprotein MlaA
MCLVGDPWYNASIHGNNEFLSKGFYITSKVTSGIDFRADNLESLDNFEKKLDRFLRIPKKLIFTRQRKQN